METLHFEITIRAAAEKVWAIMLSDAGYRKWTAAFHEGSYYEGDWKEGSEMKFLAPGEDGTVSGMYSIVREAQPARFVHVEHLGEVKNGVIDTTSESVKKWAPSDEKYTLVPQGDATQLKVEMQSPEEYKAMFEGMWAKALPALKALCEGE